MRGTAIVGVAFGHGRADFGLLGLVAFDDSGPRPNVLRVEPEIRVEWAAHLGGAVRPGYRNCRGADDGFAGLQRPAGPAHEQDRRVRCLPGYEVERLLHLLPEHGVVRAIAAVAADVGADDVDDHQPRVRLKAESLGCLPDQGGGRRPADSFVDRVSPSGRVNRSEALIDAVYRRVGPGRPGILRG